MRNCPSLDFPGYSVRQMGKRAPYQPGRSWIQCLDPTLGPGLRQDNSILGGPGILSRLQILKDVVTRSPGGPWALPGFLHHLLLCLHPSAPGAQSCSCEARAQIPGCWVWWVEEGPGPAVASVSSADCLLGVPGSRQRTCSAHSESRRAVSIPWFCLHFVLLKK